MDLSDAVRARIGRAMSAYAVVAGFAGVALFVWFGLADLLLREWVVHNAVPAVAIGVIVWFIVPRQPRNGAVWALVWSAVFQATHVLALGAGQWQLAGLGLPPDVAGLSPAELPLATALTFQVTAWVWIPGVFILLTFALLLFPGGRLPGHRWRWVAGWSVVSIAFTSLVFLWLSRPTSQLAYGADVPVDEVAAGVALALPVGFVALLIAVVGSLVALVRRFRASTGLERQQFRWFAWGAAMLGLMVPLMVAAITFPGVGLGPARVAAAAAVPVFLGAYVVAVTRHRLYEIDRVISRTVTYGVVVVVLGAVYVTVVVVFGTAVSGVTGEGGGDLAVAASVLAVVALFRPVRSRVHRAVDRRFNRSGYEARLAVEAFADRLRDEVDLETIRREVAETAAVAVQPSSVSLWVTGEEER